MTPFRPEIVVQSLPTHFDPFEASLTELAGAMQRGRLSAAELVAFYLDRIAAYDKLGPRINAISHLNPDAMREARALDRERRRTGPRGPLHGLPMVVKDNIDTVGMPTTGGCAALRDAYPVADAASVARLRAAGAIVLGKANMSELAASNGRFGYSSANGLTLNPYRLSRHASGSSSGTGAAVAANFAAFGLGTDSFGSVRGPACVHALVGMRPTHGWLDGAGVLPLAAAFDTVGPLTRHAADAALVMDVLAPGRHFSHTLATLQGRTLGVVEALLGGDDQVDALFGAAIQALETAGARMVTVRLPAGALSLYDTMLGDLVRGTQASELDAYLAALPHGAPASTAQLLDRLSDPLYAAAERATNPLTLAALRHAQATRDVPPRHSLDDVRRFGARLLQAMHEAGCEALIFPTQPCPAGPRFDQPDPAYQCRAPNPLAAMHMASAAGFPEVSVPMGFTRDGVPVGLSWMARAGADVALLSMAAAFEAATRHRRPPPMLAPRGWGCHQPHERAE